MKNVLLTGSRSGIGKAIKEYLLSEEVQEDYEVIDFEGDVRDRQDWKKMSEKHNYWAVINCAGIAEAKRIMEIAPVSFMDMMETNALPILHSIQTVGRRMIEDSEVDKLMYNPDRIIGHILNITSISGIMGFSGHAHYCASKFAAHGISQVAAKELAKYGILVNCVLPGPTNTPMWDKLDIEYSAMNDKKIGEMDYLSKNLIKRLGKPQDTATMVEFLISDKNTYITGTNIKVCGGNIIG